MSCPPCRLPGSHRRPPFLLLALAALLTVFTGCQGDSQILAPEDPDAFWGHWFRAPWAAPPKGGEPTTPACGEKKTLVLLAGQNHPVGRVEVTNNETTLTVRYFLDEGWVFESAKVAAASGLDGIPRTPTGNPIPGHFPYKAYGKEVKAPHFEVDLAKAGVKPGEEMVLAAFADVVHTATKKREGAWADGHRFVPRGNWATYAKLVLADCDGEPGTPPSFTSVPPLEAESGSPYTYTVQVDGTPDPTVAATTLPGWLTFDPVTGVVSGVPSDADAGPNTVTLTASNGVAPDAVQTFEVVVAAVPTGPLFITTWDTRLISGTEIRLPFRGAVDVVIDWGDGTVVSHTSGPALHTYGVDGVYQVRVEGTFTGLGGGTANTNEALISVDEWGETGTVDLNSAFQSASNLAAVAAPPSGIRTMRSTFQMATGFNAEIGDWDVSEVTDMAQMFFLAEAFNRDLGDWDTSSVEDMSFMFFAARQFNQDIGAWDVSQVNTMRAMFNGASRFNQDIGGWEVSRVEDMSQMFRDALDFDQDIGGWNTSAVETMQEMFSRAGQFDQDIGGWDVSNVTTMRDMFFFADRFNQEIGGWDVSSVTDMHRMFSAARAFDGDIGGWDVSNVTTFSQMFSQNSTFNQDIGGWNVSNVTIMENMFSANRVFNQDIGGWDVSNVTTMRNMFRLSDAFNQDIGGWDVSNVTNLSGMFSVALDFDQDISGWDVSNVTDMTMMFQSARSFNQDLSFWCVALIPELPADFDDGAIAWLDPLFRPVWGSCP